MKIKNQLLLTHGLLVFLALSIVAINVFVYKGIESDAQIINEAGKLRMLSYNIAQLTNQLNNQEDVSEELLIKLDRRNQDFEDILSDFTTDVNSVEQYQQNLVKLEEINKEWIENFKPKYVEILDGKSTDNSCEYINEHIDTFVNEINEMVTSYSLYARGKVNRALAINGCLVLIIIVVTIYSFTSTNRHIRKPMKILIKELKELSLIDDEVSERLKSINTDEISEMTEYFNVMMYDQLTRVFNRRSGLSKLSRMLEYDNRRQLKMSLCFIDINGLKKVNDELGHKFGDELLVSVVESVKQEIREEDFIIRMGGDEFLIVFKDIDQNTAEKVWERINQRYSTINVIEDRPYIISVSHGIVGYDNYERSEVKLLIKHADEKMYEEKKYMKEELQIKIIKNQND